MQNLQNEKTLTQVELIDSIEIIDQTGSYSLFIRHGDRDKIPEGEFGNEVELNEIGFKRAQEYGLNLSKLKVNKIFTSPIIRCMQTAEAIKMGVGREIEIIPSTLLGDPGAFVNDAKQAGEGFLELGFSECYHRLLENKTVKGNRSIYDGAQILTDLFCKSNNENGVNIFVSHDMIVALYSYAVFGKKYELGENWIKYLGGLLVKHD